MIRKCYARMSDPASGDKLSLEVLVSDGGLKIFIYDFNKGVATLSHGIKDKQSKYILHGERNAGHINLVRDNTIDYTLWVVSNYTGGNSDSDKSSPLLSCALRIVRGADTHYRMQKDFYKKTIKAR